VRITHLPTGIVGRVPGRALAAQEPRARDVAPARAPARAPSASGRRRRKATRAPAAGRHRRPLRAHPDL
jgi:hypothetical protein